MATRRCWNCDSISHMTYLTSILVAALPSYRYVVQAAFKCDECNWLQIGRALRDQSADGNTWEHNAKVWWSSSARIEWYPAVGVSKAFEDVPEHIADAAGEAHRCYSIQAYRGATALARAVIEASAKAKGITSGTLHAKIEQLEKDNHVRPHIRHAADEVRHLGNEVAHGDFADPIEAEEAEETLALMGEVLQEVFQSPARIAAAKAKREAKKAARTT